MLAYLYTFHFNLYKSPHSLSIWHVSTACRQRTDSDDQRHRPMPAWHASLRSPPPKAPPPSCCSSCWDGCGGRVGLRGGGVIGGLLLGRGCERVALSETRSGVVYGPIVLIVSHCWWCWPWWLRRDWLSCGSWLYLTG